MTREVGGNRERNKRPEPGGRGSRRSLGGGAVKGGGVEKMQGRSELELSIKTGCFCLILGHVVLSYGLDSLLWILRFKIPVLFICSYVF